MSEFLNNVYLVSPLQVVFGATDSELRRSLIPVVRAILQGDWSDVSEDLITISLLTGGLTNILYLVHNTAVNHKVIVRVFGVGTEEIIDRQTENVLFAQLSASSFGPTFYGLFENGRVEGYINARSLDPDEFSVPAIYEKVAKAAARLHSQDVPALGFDANWLWNKIDKFIALVDGTTFDGPKRENFELLQFERMREENGWVRSRVESLEAELRGSTAGDDQTARLRWLGRQFALTKPLAHNDLLAGNVLMHRSEDGSDDPSQDLVLIDYEYGAYNFRGFDIANHFNEFLGYDVNLSKFPSCEHRTAFIVAYLSHLDLSRVDAPFADAFSSPEFIAGMEEVCFLFALSSHMFWAIWAVVQAGCSTVDFDYIDYARLRFEAYHFLKKQMPDL